MNSYSSPQGQRCKRRKSIGLQVSIAHGRLYQQCGGGVRSDSGAQTNGIRLLQEHPCRPGVQQILRSKGMTINDKELVLNEGDSIYFDSSLPHGMKALNERPVKFLAVIL